MPMLDTVTMFRPFRLQAPGPPTGWQHTRYSGSRSGSPASVESFDLDDPTTGYHAHGKLGEIRYHRASLPRLLHGSNGRLIKNQAELDSALALLAANAGQLGYCASPSHHYTRVDLVWQFRGDPAQFVQAHRVCRHPRIRSNPIRYEERSIAFAGSEMRISIYDKVRERFGRDGNIVRVEVQLRGGRLEEELGDGDRVTHLDFAACYQAYRRILLGFQPSTIPVVSSIGRLLALGEREGWQSGGVPCFDLYTAGLCKRQVHRIRKEIASLRPELFSLDWEQLLPADGPPPVIEITDPTPVA